MKTDSKNPSPNLRTKSMPNESIAPDPNVQALQRIHATLMMTFLLIASERAPPKIPKTENEIVKAGPARNPNHLSNCAPYAVLISAFGSSLELPIPFAYPIRKRYH